MRKMRKMSVFSIVAVLALVILMGCTFVPKTTIKNDVQNPTMNTVEVTQSKDDPEVDDDADISAAVFTNPDLLEADN